MTKIKERQQAIEMRKKGMSYSQIAEKLKINKSTLSGWLYDMPLSEKRIRELRADNPIRIERYRNTMRLKKEEKFKQAYEWSKIQIGKLSKREIFLTGLFLYWAEGSKTQNSYIALTNTNPNMLKFFILWLDLLAVPKDKLRVHLHLYSDMNIKRQVKYWSSELKIPVSQFRKPYIKNTSLNEVTYKNGFGQGTCSVYVGDARLTEKVLAGIEYIQDSLL